MKRTRQMAKSQVVLYQGEATPYVFVVRQGIVRAYTILDNGNRVIIGLFGKGDYFPISPSPDLAIVAPFYYDMMTDGAVDLVNPDRPEEPEGYQLRTVNRRYLGALLHINALAQASASQRLAHTLRYLMMRFGEPASNKAYVRIPIKLTQQDIAELSNLSRETTNAELNVLKDKNIILVRQKYYTIHSRLLSKFINDDIEESLPLA